MPEVSPAIAAGKDQRVASPALLARWGTWLPVLVIGLTVWAAYANSWGAPFVFDDLKAVGQNPTIRHLRPLADVLSPPVHATGAAHGRSIDVRLADQGRRASRPLANDMDASSARRVSSGTWAKAKWPLAGRGR